MLLLAALTAGFVQLEQVKETGTYLTGIFPLLFVPAAAGLMEPVSYTHLYQNGHEPTPEELAKAMDMSMERLREIQRMAQEPASLESPVGEEEDSSLGDFVADENAEAPGKAADRAMVAQQINCLLYTSLRLRVSDGIGGRQYLVKSIPQFLDAIERGEKIGRAHV